jgi:hypothetical protein
VLENPVPVTVRVVPPVVGPEVGEIDTSVKADPDFTELSWLLVTVALLREGLQAAEKARIKVIPRTGKFLKNVKRLTNVHIRSCSFQIIY